jgi:hypothetical protein
MELKTLFDTPPWDWPRHAGNILEQILIDNRTNESERLIAAELAGDFAVINDELANVLMTIIHSADEPEQLRARAVISLGPILEHADTDGFEDPDDVPITQRTFRNITDSLHKLYRDNAFPGKYGVEFWRHPCEPTGTGAGTRSGQRIPTEARTGCSQPYFRCAGFAVLTIRYWRL